MIFPQLTVINGSSSVLSYDRGDTGLQQFLLQEMKIALSKPLE